MSDGVVHAGVGKACRFGWPRDEVVRYAERYCSYGISSSRLMSILSNRCNKLYDGEPGDDTTVITIKVTASKTVNLFTGPPVKKQMINGRWKNFFRRRDIKLSAAVRRPTLLPVI